MRESAATDRRAHNMRGAFVIILLGLTCIILRIPYLTESLWHDELWSTSYRLGNPQLLWNVILENTHPPLHFVSMYAWVGFFGDSNLSVRLPFFVFGLASVSLTYILATRFFNRAVGMLSAFLLVVAPVHIWYSHEARPYTALAFYLLLTLYSFERVRTAERALRWQTLYCLSLFALVFTHYYSLVFLLLFALRCAVNPQPTDRRTLALTVAIGVLFCVFLWIQSTYGDFRTELAYLRRFDLFEWWMLCFQWFGLGNSLFTLNPYLATSVGPRLLLDNPLQLSLHCVLFLCLVHGLWNTLQNSEVPERRSLPCYFFALPMIPMALFVLGNEAVYIERSMFSILPLYAIFVSHGILSIRTNVIRVLGIGVVVSVSVAAYSHHALDRTTWTVYKPNPDWAALAEHLDRRYPRQDRKLVIVAATSPDVLRHYLPNVELVQTQRARAAFLEKALQEPIPEFFLIRNAVWKGDFKNVLDRVTNLPGYSAVEVTRFRLLELYRFSSDAGGHGEYALSAA